MVMAWHRPTKRAAPSYIPGVGPMLATALVASVADPRTFRSGRNFSAWIGLVPKQHSSGGKDRLGSISKQGDRYLRSLFVAGALAVIRYAKIHGTKHRPLAHGVVRAASDEGRRHRACQQDCAHGLGHDGQGRALQATRCAGGVNEIAPDSRRDVKVGRAEQHVMQSRSIRRSGQPTCAIDCRMRGFDRDLIREALCQRSCEPHLQAEHMAAPTMLHT